MRLSGPSAVDVHADVTRSPSRPRARPLADPPGPAGAEIGRRPYRPRRVATLVAVGALLAAPLATAGPPREPTRAELEERVRRLEEIIRTRGLDRPPAPAAAPAEAGSTALDPQQVEAIVDDRLKKQKVLAGWKDGFFLESANGDFRLKLRGYVQTHARFFPLEEGDTGTDSFFLRRVRPIVEGTVYRHFDFRIMPDFGDGGPSIQDAYGEIRYLPYARLRGGKFKVPLSLERLQSGADLLFVERSIANNLAPNRDVGFQLGGDVLDGTFSYALGGFNGVPDAGSSDTDTTSDKELAARIWAEPFRTLGDTPVKGLGFGIAGTWGDQRRGDSLASLRYRTAGRSTFFRYDVPSGTAVVAHDERWRVAPQAYWFRGPFGVMGEYLWTAQGARRVDGDGAVTEAVFDHSAWFVQASWVLTGEAASYRGVAPINAFDPRNGRWGAFEVAVRGARLTVDDEAFDLGFAERPASTQAVWNVGAGLNWYLNRSFKLQANWEHSEFDTEVDFGGDLRGGEDVFLANFQVSF